MADLSMYLDPSGRKEVWGSSPILTSSQRDAYLERIGLDPSTIRSRQRDLELLTDVHLSHHLNVPFETTSIHMGYDGDDEKPVTLGGGPGITIDPEGAFHHIVTLRRGGYCFSLNRSFASLLRSLGYPVSEFCGRSFVHRNQDPATSGYAWTGLAHECLVTEVLTVQDGKETSKRYLVDVGFGGGGCMYPIELIDGATSGSLTRGESFTLINEGIPGVDPEFLRDIPKGWTIYRNFDKTVTKEPFSTPLYHFEAISRTGHDFECLNFYNSHYSGAIFAHLLTATILLPNGARRTLIYTPKTAKENKANMYEKDGMFGELVNQKEVDTTKKRNLLKALEEGFGFKI